MAILVNFFAGDLNVIRRCLDSGGWPTELPASKFDGEVGFKFGIMPEQAFDALIESASRIANAETFRFEDCTTGELAQDGESFKGAVNGRFIEFFSGFPDQRIHELSVQWAAELNKLYDAEFLAKPRRKRTWSDRVGSGIQAVLFGAIMFPILAACYLIPSFRRARAMNKRKLAAHKNPTLPTNDELISSLIRLCRSACQKREPLTYTWNI